MSITELLELCDNNLRPTIKWQILHLETDTTKAVAFDAIKVVLEMMFDVRYKPEKPVTLQEMLKFYCVQEWNGQWNCICEQIKE